ncbi:hypothetical protein Pth03_34770 [Planotetraspora thailandica]|uniref:DUF4375 domain-containing protein n=1 Tax=Planotetraspora thailandica TaxID=487172 RepID=A0A8J3V1I1_9ACTN|nr:hypothetical protein [Planotetraspora thailandica]GII55088.1 hypothetical protein Pth03_34770 [Planotetraspora thailandica]
MSSIGHTSPAGPEPARLTTRELHELPDADLVARCMAPIARRIHSETVAAAQSLVIRRLTADQAALLVFWLLYGNAGPGLSRLCRERPHRVADEDFWRLVEAGLGHLGDTPLLALTGRLRAEIAKVVPAGAARDADDGGVHLAEELARLDPDALKAIDDDYDRIAPESLRRTAGHIREHADRFVSIAA